MGVAVGVGPQAAQPLLPGAAHVGAHEVTGWGWGAHGVGCGFGCWEATWSWRDSGLGCGGQRGCVIFRPVQGEDVCARQARAAGRQGITEVWARLNDVGQAC